MIQNTGYKSENLELNETGPNMRPAEFFCWKISNLLKIIKIFASSPCMTFKTKAQFQTYFWSENTVPCIPEWPRTWLRDDLKKKPSKTTFQASLGIRTSRKSVSQFSTNLLGLLASKIFQKTLTSKAKVHLQQIFSVKSRATKVRPKK